MQDDSKLRGYAKQYHKEISELLRRMPRELLLLLKANDCLRSIDAVLGRPLNTIAITARACSKAAAEGDSVAARNGASKGSELSKSNNDDHATSGKRGKHR
jgi:hypothetical protein